MEKEIIRCDWSKANQLMIDYHDKEWGVPLHDDRKLFEFIVLDSFQAGLSWSTILNKRETFRAAFDGFDPAKIIQYNDQKIEELMNNAGIIRNRMKINAAVTNARAFLELQSKHGTFDAYIWKFTDGKRIINGWKSMSEVPASTPISDAMSKDLKQNGFKFVGSTICYAFMQAAGMINDHVVSCFRYEEVGK